MNQSIEFVSLIACDQVTVFGVLYSLLSLSSIFTNTIVLWTIYRNKPLHTAVNYIIAIFSGNNLLNSFIQLPLIAVNAFNCRFLFGNAGCVYLSIMYAMNMVTNIYLFIMISIERYLVICKPFKNMKFNTKKSLCIISAVIFVLCVSWSVAPLVGVAEYGYEYTRITCVISGSGPYRTLFVVVLSIILYAIPLVVLVFTNIASIQAVKKSAKKFENDRMNKKKLKKEVHLVKVAAALIATFFGLAIPQSLVPLLRSYIEGTNTIYILSTITLFLTRTSVLMPALINLLMNKDIKKYLYKSVKIRNHTTNTTR